MERKHSCKASREIKTNKRCMKAMNSTGEERLYATAGSFSAAISSHLFVVFSESPLDKSMPGWRLSKDSPSIFGVSRGSALAVVRAPECSSKASGGIRCLTSPSLVGTDACWSNVGGISRSQF